MPLRRGGRNKNTKVSIFLKIFLFSVMALVFLCYGVGVLNGNGEAFKGIVDC